MPRGRRNRETPRAITESPKHINRTELAAGRVTLAGELAQLAATARPRTRGDCVDGLRPCPFVGCRYSLYLDVTEAGSIKINFPFFEPWEMPQSCALDVADEGGHTLEEVGAWTNTTRERARQVETKALVQLAAALRPHQGDQ